jgi:hypothetical protein
MDWQGLTRLIESCELNVDKSSKGLRISAKGPAAVAVLAILAMAILLQ